MNLKPYPKYKDSGIEWLGEIPEGWEVKSLRRIGKIVNGSTPDSNNEKYWDGDIVWLTPDDLGKNQSKYITNSRRQITVEGYKNCGTEIVPQDSLIISTRAPIGHLALTTVDACFNQGCRAVVFKKNFNPSFFYYYFKSINGVLNAYGQGTTFYELGANKLAIIPVVIPSDREQEIVATFLDYKTAKIDELIKKNERLIDFLKEKRQAVISHAVTKGLNPNAKMKDSGIEWIGKIPESWTLIPMKYVTYMKGRIGWQGLKQSEFTDEGPYLITGMNFKDGVIRWEEVYHITEERYNEAPEIHLKVGDVLMTKDGTIGKVLFVDVLPDRASLNSHLLVLRPLKDHFLPKYLYYLLHSDYFKDHIEINKTGTTFFGITQEAVERYKILLPPTKDQENIVSFIDKETAKIDRIIINIQSQIESLKEYRQALISNVVTGKVRVED